MRQITLNRQLLGLEDLLFGTGTVTQNRANQVVTITEINAGNLPFDETRTLVEFAQDTNLEELGNSVEAINNLNNNLDKLLIVEDNLPIINNVEAIKESIVTLDTNILALQNIYTNMSSINTVEDNLPIINNVEAIKDSIVTLDTNILALQNIDTNMSSINTVEDNLPEVVSVAQNIVPNLTEILNVDTLAAQVTQDKSDVSSMKLVVETIYDTFDDRFLGTKIVDPTLDNDGNALIDGAMCFNTSSNTMKVYDVDTTTWYSIPQIYLSALLDVQLTSITSGNVLRWNGTKWINYTLSKSDVELNLVDNTADSAKNVLSSTKLTTARTINGVSFDGSANITISDSTAVKLTGNQTLDDIKTYTSSPIVPTPTTDTQVANKVYVDSKYSGFKNYIINGGFDIDQRNNKAGFTIAAGSYAFSADRWLINNTTNQPVSITVSEFPTPSGGRLRIKFDNAPTSGHIQISQKIENVAILGGKQVTLSHSFACDAMTITNDATQNFGSGGSSNVLTGFSSINTTGILSSLTRFSSSIILPSVYGKTIGTGSYTQITYSLPIRTTNIQTLTEIQLEEGSVATPFENRPYGLELSLCQRYYQIIKYFTTMSVETGRCHVMVASDFRVLPSISWTDRVGNVGKFSVNGENNITVVAGGFGCQGTSVFLDSIFVQLSANIYVSNITMSAEL